MNKNKRLNYECIEEELEEMYQINKRLEKENQQLKKEKQDLINALRKQNELNDKLNAENK